MKKHCLYSASAGLEVSLGKVPTKKGSDYLQGTIFLRAFPIEKGGKEKQISLKLLPQEAYRMSLVIKRVLQTKKTESGIAPHEFNGEGGKVVTTVMCEAWEREGKGGYAVKVIRKGQTTTTVNIPLGQVDFMFLGKFLDNLSVDACFEERQDESVQTATNGNGNGKTATPADSSNGCSPSGDDFNFQEPSF